MIKSANTSYRVQVCLWQIMGGSNHCYFFGCSSTANVVTASNNDVKRAETRAGQGC